MKLDRLSMVKKNHAKLISKLNQPISKSNGIYKRFINPVITAEHTPIHWRYDLNNETNPFEGLDEKEQANYYWTMASKGLSEASAAIFYNDQQPDKIYYQGFAFLKLGNIEEANTRFKSLINFGKKHITDNVSIDYFAVSLPDMLIWDADLNKNNEIHCRYLMGLGFLGMQRIKNAATEFMSVLNLNSSHSGVQVHNKLLKVISSIN